ncbi:MULTISPECIES: sensor histidine kinase [unclassified Olleya]|jgi:signal transduction histidine kinase|uniref:sensor histidine kinase n=1 Tax=unclassified Olleya TaxID=2615019 RepID=UPI0011A383DE|nr:GAF domain-containing sensor histidine kinase [Olleya sp. Hel_I_94]TVZ46379.1 phospho-acceptor domain-containing protein [Olleya sp. Hel_I_94]|tara:strand:- start:28655 stop:29851 length:1197 start_codon:yes stop_codon:yes gene_type:complete
MIVPDFPKNEIERLSEVKKYKILDTLPESDFDNITSLVATICEVPISLITLLDTDRNFLKSHHGLNVQESPRDISFCGHAILQSQDIFVVEDSRKDSRFKDNPLIDQFNAIFYAGVPLRNKDGLALGTLCVYDHEPRQLTEIQKKALITLGKQVMNLFDLRLNNRLLDESKKELLERNADLSKFASHVSHDLKSPLANIISLTAFLKEEEGNVFTEESIDYINYIEESADSLKNYIDGILIHYKANELLNEDKQTIALNALFEEVKRIHLLDDLQFKTNTKNQNIFINKAAVTQILINLVDNALKYNNKPNPEVILNYSENKNFHIFSVTDNGIGIAQEQQNEVFKLFNNNNQTDAKGNKGTGIGLFTVKNLVKKLNGDIVLKSQIGIGSTFTFTISK